MANTLTGLIPVLYDAVDVVSRELTGFIPAVTLNATADQAALNQTITYPVVPAMSAGDIAAAATGPDPSDQTIGTGSMSISKSRSVTFYWTGEDQLGLAGNYRPVAVGQFAQAMRTLVNEVENDVAATYIAASRAYGTAGTAPFGTAADFTDFAGVARILDENGAPVGDRQLVVGVAAMANLRGKQSILYKVNEAGTEDFLRRGILGDVQGLAIRYSGQVKSHTKGTGTSYQLAEAGAVGETALDVDTGSGTIVAGDVVTFAGTTTKYINGTALSGGVITLNDPGLLVAEADNDAITVGNDYTANMAFSRSAIHLLLRTPAMPQGGDAADDVTVVTDPQTGIAFQVAVYKQRRRIAIEVGLAWGVKATKSAHMALLIG